MDIKQLRDLITHLSFKVNGGERCGFSLPPSQRSLLTEDKTLDAKEALDLMRDGLRFRLIKLRALEGAHPDDPLRDESFIGEIDRRLAKL
jgi:hypothetical protein